MPDIVVSLTGGLSLQEDPTQCAPGTLRDALNYEVTQQDGYSLRPGWAFYDGTIIGQELQDYLYVDVSTGWNAVLPSYAEKLTLTVGGIAVLATCIGFYNQGAIRVICFAYANQSIYSYLSIVGSTVTAIAGAISGFAWAGSKVVQQVGYYSNNGDPITPTVTGGFSVSSYLQLNAVINAYQTASVKTVPGNPLSPVDSTFMVNDIPYCVHDCILFFFNSGTNASVNLLEGHVIKSVGGAVTYGTVLKYVITSGDFSTADAAGYVVVYDVPLGTTYPANNTQMNAYTADGTIAIGNIFKYTSSGSLAAKPANTRALIYKTVDQTAGYIGSGTGAGYASTFTGWSRVPLTREIQYVQTLGSSGIGFGPTGGSPFSIYEYTRQGLTNILSQLTPITSAYWPCQTATGTGWTNINNIKVDDGVFATLAIPFNAGGNRPGQYFTAQKYAFTDVPVGSAILGIQVEIHAKTTTSNTTLVPAEVLLQKPDGTYTGNKGTSTFLTTVNTYTTYGGAADMWGYGWKSSDLLGTNFGVFIRFTNISTTTNDTANVDFVGIQCTYIPPGRIVYFRNSTSASPTDVPAFVVHYTLDNNTQFSSNNGVGTLTIYSTGTEASFTAAGKTRVVNSGEQIRDAPGGAGNLLGWTSSTDTPSSLPCGNAIDSNNSRWEWFPYNFYADPSAQMALGANGVEFGVGFDGTYLIRVRTGRRIDLENPRHVIAYASNAHWGYNSGDTIVSAPGRPLTVAGLQLSQVYNIGQPVVGYGDLQGQTLAVFGPRRVFGLQGTDPTNYTQVTLSPSLGAFEYTVANVEGEVMWTSFRGVEDMSTTNAYGDFDTNPLSQASTPWLQPRLQGDSRIAIQNQRPCCALACRNKRQYRLFFNDGYTFTLTRFGPSNTPMGMPGKYIDSVGFPLVARHAFQGIRSDGKEMLFSTWDALAPYNNPVFYPSVARLDVGTYEGGNQALSLAFIELNPIYPYQISQKVGTPDTQIQFQYVALFAQTHPFNQAGCFSTAVDDTPTMAPGGNYQLMMQNTTVRPQVTNFAPDQTQLFLPVPVYEGSNTIAAEGRMIRLRYETAGTNARGFANENFVGGPFRANKVSISFEVLNQERD